MSDHLYLKCAFSVGEKLAKKLDKKLLEHRSNQSNVILQSIAKLYMQSVMLLQQTLKGLLGRDPNWPVLMAFWVRMNVMVIVTLQPRRER